MKTYLSGFGYALYLVGLMSVAIILALPFALFLFISWAISETEDDHIKWEIKE